MKKNILAILAVVMLCLAPLPAFARGGSLTEQDIQRLKTVKGMLKDVDDKPLAQTIRELEMSKSPQVTLSMREAMAHAYTDIIKNQNVEGKNKRVWLYSMVTLNMAYLQMVGPEYTSPKADPLNILICQKLKEYLPKDIYRHPAFSVSID